MNLHYSQTKGDTWHRHFSFTTLWIYTILKHREKYGTNTQRFTTLWIYTILKQPEYKDNELVSFTTLWIYTILKQVNLVAKPYTVSLPYEFTLFSNLK